MLTVERSGKRVAFVHEASSSIGMGHIVRSLVLARTLHLRGHDSTGITIGDEKAVLFAERRARQEHFVWPLQVARDVSQAVEVLMHAQPQIAVVDCSIASRDVVRACAGSGVPVVALDYFVVEPPMPVAIVNLIDHNPAALSGHPPDRSGVEYHEGPRYAIVREEFIRARERRKMRGEREKPDKVVIAFGGADPAGNSGLALGILARWPGEFSVELIVGPLFKAAVDNAVDAARQNCNVRKHVSPEDMGALFEDADLIFCGGGGTLLEALCVGVPAIVIAQNNAELRHAESLARRGACWVSGMVDWEAVSSCEDREGMSARARECVDGIGAERICDVIEHQLA